MNTQDGYGNGSIGRTILSIIVGVVLFAGVVLAGHYAGWWLATDSAGRQVKLDQLAPGSQQAWADKITERISQIDSVNVQLAAPSLTVEQKDLLSTQKAGLVHATCADFARLVTLTVSPDQASWKAANCS